MVLVPKKDETGLRRYGKWTGNLKGHQEDIRRCIAEVPSFPAPLFTQCSRNRGYGPEGEFCKQHAKKATAGAY
jgi:hypothetical protein